MVWFCVQAIVFGSLLHLQASQQGHIVACINLRWGFPSYLVLKDLSLVMVMFCMGVCKSKASAGGNVIFVHSRHWSEPSDRPSEKHIRLWTRLELQFAFALTATSSIDLVFSSDIDGRSSSIRNLVCSMFSISAEALDNIVSSCAETGFQAKYSLHSLLEGNFQSHYWQVNFENYSLTSEFINEILCNLSSPTPLKKRADHKFVLTYSEDFNFKHPGAWFLCFYLSAILHASW